MANPLTQYLDWNSDAILTPAGSIQSASGWDIVRQRIVRRMLTNPAQTLPSGYFTPPDYIFHPKYGIGLASLVDEAEGSQSLAELEQKISKGVLEDTAVDSSAPPSIQFSKPNINTFWILIGVTLVNGTAGTIAIGSTEGT